VSTRPGLPSNLLLRLACHWLSDALQADAGDVSGALPGVMPLVGELHAGWLRAGGGEAVAWVHVSRVCLVAAAGAALSVATAKECDSGGSMKGSAQSCVAGVLEGMGMPFSWGGGLTGVCPAPRPAGWRALHDWRCVEVWGGKSVLRRRTGWAAVCTAVGNHMRSLPSFHCDGCVCNTCDLVGMSVWGWGWGSSSHCC
jgi:hypothetical protein